jgi:hypothetical protein
MDTEFYQQSVSCFTTVLNCYCYVKFDLNNLFNQYREGFSGTTVNLNSNFRAIVVFVQNEQEKPKELQ